MSVYEVGQRIRLLAMPGDPCPVETGTEGTIRSIYHWPDSAGAVQLSIDWDNGRTLACVVPPDRLEVLS